MKVTNISEKTQSSLSASPEQIFQEALESLGKFAAFKNGKKALVLMLDDTDGSFNISYLNSGMKDSQVISLLECTKTMFKDNLGY